MKNWRRGAMIEFLAKWWQSVEVIPHLLEECLTHHAMF